MLDNSTGPPELPDMILIHYFVRFLARLEAEEKCDVQALIAGLSGLRLMAPSFKVETRAQWHVSNPFHQPPLSLFHAVTPHC